MTSVVYLNGEFLPRDQAKLPVDERGFIFGDGLYEVTLAHEGRFFELDRHLRRLEYGLRGLSITGAPSAAELTELHHRMLAENDLRAGEATVYVQITRGVAPRTHHFPVPAVPPTVFLSAARVVPNNELREKGGSAITHPDIRWARCDLKTVNLLGNVLAKQAAAAAGAAEAILVRDGVVTEGSHTNAFGVLDGEIRTYPRSNYILGGVTRDVIFEIAAELGLPLRETPILVQDLPRLSELFITGTTTEVTPIVQLDGRPVGNGTPGPVARTLRKALRARIEGRQHEGAIEAALAATL